MLKPKIFILTYHHIIPYLYLNILILLSYRLCNPILLFLPRPSLLGGIHFEASYHLQTEFWRHLQSILPTASKTETGETNNGKNEEEHEVNTGSITASNSIPIKVSNDKEIQQLPEPNSEDCINI